MDSSICLLHAKSQQVNSLDPYNLIPIPLSSNMSPSKINVPAALSVSFSQTPSRSRAHAPFSTLPFSVITKYIPAFLPISAHNCNDFALILIKK